MSNKLTARQLAFIREYPVDHNATKAAIRAKFSRKGARQQGARLLANAAIRAALKQVEDRAAEKAGLNLERLDAETARSAYLDPREACDSKGQLLPLSQMPADVARAVHSYKEDPVLDEEGRVVGYKREVKFNSKLEAISLGYKRLGALTERVEHTGAIQVVDPYAQPPSAEGESDG